MTFFYLFGVHLILRKIGLNMSFFFIVFKIALKEAVFVLGFKKPSVRTL